MLFDSNGVIKKYDGPEDILKEFFELRMGYYMRRKAALLKVRHLEMTMTSIVFLFCQPI